MTVLDEYDNKICIKMSDFGHGVDLVPCIIISDCWLRTVKYQMRCPAWFTYWGQLVLLDKWPLSTLTASNPLALRKVAGCTRGMCVERKYAQVYHNNLRQEEKRKIVILAWDTNWVFLWNFKMHPLVLYWIMYILLTNTWYKVFICSISILHITQSQDYFRTSVFK